MYYLFIILTFSALNFAVFSQERLSKLKCIEGDCKNGYGRAYYQKNITEMGDKGLFSFKVTTLPVQFNDVYEGNFKKKKRHGKGEIYQAFGKEVHKGEWVKGKLHGKTKVSMLANSNSPMTIFFKKNKINRSKYKKKVKVKFIPTGVSSVDIKL